MPVSISMTSVGVWERSKTDSEKAQKGNKAQDIAICLARELGGLRCEEVGNFFGALSAAAVTSRYNHVATEMMHDRKLNRE